MKRFIAIFMTLCLVLGLSSVSVWAAEEDSWQEEKPIPTTRSLSAYCAIDDKIYVIGGAIGNYALDTMEIYDTKTDTWSTGTSMPIKQSGATASVVGDNIYVIGGTADRSTSRAVYIYNVKKKYWTRGKDMPTARCYLTSEVIGEKIYVIGGTGENNGNEVEIYDTKTDTWSTGTSMPTARWYLTSVTYGNKIYAIGGSSSSGSTDKVEIYDPQADSWSRGESLPTKVSGATSVVANNKIYVMGGSQEDDVIIIDIIKKTWTKGPSFLTKHHSAASALVNNKIYLIGGSSVASMESLEIETSQSDTPKLAVLLNPTETVQLSTSYNLDNNLNYTWSSTNEAVATVDRNGKVTAVAVGTADIYAQNADGSFKQFIPVRVTDAADELRLAVHLKTGEKAKLYLADDASKVTWKSLDETVATVSTGGQVTGVKQGLVILQGELDGKGYQIYVRVNG